MFWVDWLCSQWRWEGKQTRFECALYFFSNETQREIKCTVNPWEDNSYLSLQTTSLNNAHPPVVAQYRNSSLHLKRTTTTLLRRWTLRATVGFIGIVLLCSSLRDVASFHSKISGRVIVHGRPTCKVSSFSCNITFLMAVVSQSVCTRSIRANPMQPLAAFIF